MGETARQEQGNEWPGHLRPVVIERASEKKHGPLHGTKFEELQFKWGIDDGGSKEERERARAIILLDSIVYKALSAGASDIKIGPQKGSLKVQFAIDGEFYEQKDIQRMISSDDTGALINRIKILGNMDVANWIHPKDGGAKLSISGRTLQNPLELKFRVASLPQVYGESIVMRILDIARAFPLEVLLPDHVRARYEEAISTRSGIVLCTGPTGSGKTTTLYSTIQARDNGKRNIMTVEDPVEYDFEGRVWQVQVNNGAKPPVTFASVLRSFLRSAPHIILVGEIRDEETLDVAIQASLTGHQVFSTLHTNDAATTVSRMVDMGAQPYLLADCLRAVMAQRLVPKLCDGCKKKSEIGVEALLHLDPEFESEAGDRTVYERGDGCGDCSGRGVDGRVGVYELLTVSEKISEMIRNGAPAHVIREAAKETGMTTLNQELARVILDGSVSYLDALEVAGLPDKRRKALEA